MPEEARWRYGCLCIDRESCKRTWLEVCNQSRVLSRSSTHWPWVLIHWLFGFLCFVWWCDFRAKYGIEEMCRDQWKWASNNPWGYQKKPWKQHIYFIHVQALIKTLQEIVFTCFFFLFSFSLCLSLTPSLVHDDLIYFYLFMAIYHLYSLSPQDRKW